MITSLVRTWAPILAGWLLALPIARPLLDAAGVTPGPSATAAVAGGLAGVYYAAARALESRWPTLGWLLGQPGAPSYGGRHRE